MEILGVRVDATNPDDAFQRCLTLIKRQEKGQVCVLGAHGLYEAKQNPEFLKILSHSFLNVPDGMPLVWVNWLRGSHDVSRVYGPSFMMKVVNEGKGLRHFFFGGNEGVVDKLQESLMKSNPEIQIVGKETPPFRELNDDEICDLASRLNRSQADVIWVGLSTPKQEKLIWRLLPYLSKGLLVGVGAAFDFCSGMKKDAPEWVKKLGLQWLSRLLQEPSRLWRRYLKIVPFFLVVLLREFFKDFQGIKLIYKKFRSY